MGIMGSIAVLAHVDKSVMITAYSAATGWVTGLTPTGAILMGSLAIAHINITTWWRWIAKLWIFLFVLICIFLAICLLNKLIEKLIGAIVTNFM